MKYKPKCKECKKPFDKLNSQHIICSYECLIKYRNKKQVKKTEKRKYTKISEQSFAELVQVLQKDFNKFIRQRDTESDYFTCINCSKVKHKSKCDAGHFFAISTNPSVRFDENNVHTQCNYCNRFSSSGHLHYKENLIKKIGVNKFNLLVAKSNKSLNLSRFELLEKIKYYRKLNKL